MSKGKDITGMRFGNLTAVSPTNLRVGSSVVWQMKCDCGREILKSVSGLKSAQLKGQSPHCGCKGGGGRGQQPIPGSLGVTVSKSVDTDESKALRNLHLLYRRSALKRGYTWNISEYQFRVLTSRNCAYCGCPPRQIHRIGCGHVYVYNGLDRILNDEGYEHGNVVACCKICNRAKGTLHIDEFLQWLKQVATFRHSDGS